MEQFKNYINGKWQTAISGKTFQNINPANHEDIIGEFPLSGQEDVDQAVAAAKEAFKKWNEYADRPICKGNGRKCCHRIHVVPYRRQHGPARARLHRHDDRQGPRRQTGFERRDRFA